MQPLRPSVESGRVLKASGEHDATPTLSIDSRKLSVRNLCLGTTKHVSH
jgi:hypothetical protein